MAEIRIEEKKQNWLPWILGILGFVLLAWFAVDFFDKDGEPELLTADEVNFPDADLTDRPDNDVLNAKVQQNTKQGANQNNDFDGTWDGVDADYNTNKVYFLSSIDRLDDADMGIHHDYCNVALRGLANSLTALAKDTKMTKAADVEAKCQLIKTNAAKIQEDWKDHNHADMIRTAAMASVSVMKEIQEEKFPQLKNEVMKMEMAAKEIQKRELTLDQKRDVKNFFSAAANVFEQMKV